MDYAAESLKKHKEWKGKIEVICRAPWKRVTISPWLIPRALPSLAWKFRKMLT